MQNPQTRRALATARAWFLEITLMWTSVCVCMCVCAPGYEELVAA